MPRVDPGSAGNSYLVYKLIINEGNHGADGELGDDPWLGGIDSRRPVPSTEIKRLRSWFVRGDPMPPFGHIQPIETRAVVRWILGGAPTHVCVN